jgi:inosose dehydratase
MKRNLHSRRVFFQNAMVTGVFLTSSPTGWISKGGSSLHIASNEYTWSVFFGREKMNFADNLDQNLGLVAKSGLDGFEPNLDTVQGVEKYLPLLKKHQLEMRSFYVNSLLHERERVVQNLERILGVAKRARDFGTEIVVTNPNPINWGTKEAKTDEQLKIQADALNQLGKQLNDMSLTLAYHNHDMELLNAAREFHHMMVATDPKYVTLCLDSHWIYRGSGNSSVALFDIVELYGNRISELHIRQSQRGIWTETFGKGDLDYERLVRVLAKKKLKPHLVLEQAVEEGSDKTLSPLEAHQKSVQAAREVFAPLA